MTDAGCSANWVDGAAVDEKVEVGPVGAVRVVARCADLLARFPPAVLATDHVLVEGVIQPCASADAAGRGRNPHPVAGADAAGGGEVRMELNLRVGRATAEAWDVAVLRLAEMRVRISGKRAARSRHERGETPGSSNSGSGG